MSKNTTVSDDSANAVSPTLTVAVQSANLTTPRPKTPRLSQSSRTTRYPAEPSVQPHHPHQHRYEGFEELLREAGYKETRIYTPERERVTNKNETVETGNNDAERGARGGERAEATKLKSVVGFLAGFLVSTSNTERREDYAHNETTRHTVTDSLLSQPAAAQLSSSPSSAGSSSQSVVASPANVLPPDISQQTYAQSDIHMHTPTPNRQSRSNFAYSQSNASYSSIASASTTTQPKYLRSAHIQHMRQVTGSQQKTNIPITSDRRRHSEMLPPPVPPVPPQYRNQTHQTSPSKPTTPSHIHFNSNRPPTSTQSRPTTPATHPHQAPPTYSRPGSRNQNHDLIATHPLHLRPTQSEPLPGSQNPDEYPVPSKAHAYLRRMASVQKIFDESGSRVVPSDAENSEMWTQAEEEDTPRPKFRSTPGPVPKGMNLWSSFTSTASSNSFSSGSSTHASHSTSATSPQTGLWSGLYQEDEGSEPDEENGGYFNLIRSRSQSRTRREMDLRGLYNRRVRASRTVESGEEEIPRWWGLRQTKSMVHVKVQEEDETLAELGVKRRKSAITVSNLGPKAMVDSTNLVVPVPVRARSTSPALPYLVTRLSSPVPPDAAEYSRGRVQEKKTRVYCRSQSLPRRRKSGRGRWGMKELSDEEPVPILIPNTSDTESIDDQDHTNGEAVSNSMERYLSGWGMDINATFLSPHSASEESSTSTSTHRSPPPRQNSIRSLKRHLKRDANMEQRDEEIPPVTALLTRTAGRGRGKDRGGLPGGWLVG